MAFANLNRTRTYDIADLINLKIMDSGKYCASTNPVLQVLIAGVFDSDSVLSHLNGFPGILQKILEEVTKYWNICVRVCMPDPDDQYLPFMEMKCNEVIQFPDPTDIRITMMPFVIGKTFSDTKLPHYVWPYFDRIMSKKYAPTVMNYGIDQWKRWFEQDLGKIGYLTIHEGYVESGASLHEAGLRTLCPGKIFVCCDEDTGENIYVPRENWAKDDNKEELDNARGYGYALGYGPWLELSGGIYCMINVSDSCQLWRGDCDCDREIWEWGNVEHLRDVLIRHPNHPHSVSPEQTKANTLYWFTDRTFHEWLPLDEGCYVQYFQLVMSEVSVWFDGLWTPNPEGVVPDSRVTKIVKMCEDLSR